MVRDPFLKMEVKTGGCALGTMGLRGVTLGLLQPHTTTTTPTPHHRVRNVISGRAPGGAGEGPVPSHVKKEVQRILGHIQAPPRPFLLR